MVAFFRSSLAVALVCLFLAACTLQTGPTKFTAVPLQPNAPLPDSASVYVTMPADYSQGTSVETGSGVKVQKALAQALAGLPVKATFASVPQTLAETMRNAAVAHCSHVVATDITVWHDPPATFQSISNPDRGGLIITVYALEAPDSPYRTDSLECSGMATSINGIGAYGPHDCLKSALGEWRKHVFGR